MMLAIARAELRYQLRSLHLPATFAVYFGFAFLLTANAAEFESLAPGGTVLANAPWAITSLLIKMSVLAVFAVPAFIAPAVLRDTGHGFDGILFALPLRKSDYLAGRFSGAFVALMLAVAGAPIGHLLGALWPWADRGLLGPIRLDHYAGVFFGLTAPTLLAVSAIVFALAVLSRSLIVTYLGVLVLLMLYLVTGSLDGFPPLLDPFLFEVFDAQTRYWTAAERNAHLLGFGGPVLHSRLLWTGLAGLFFLLALRFFSFRAPARKASPPVAEKADPAVVRGGAAAQAAPAWGPTTGFSQLLVRTAFEVKAVVKSFPFVVLISSSFFLLVVNLLDREVTYGVNALPVTRLMLADTSVIVMAVMAILVFYSAEVMHRERSHGISQIIDAVPAASGVFVASKLAALAVIVASILGLGLVVGVAVQVLEGYFDIDWGLYLERGLVYPLLPFLYLAVLTCFFQVLVRNRYLGMLGFGLFLGAMVLSRDVFGIEHPLASFVFPPPSAPLSEMNGTGRFMALGYALRVYWGAIAGLMLLATFLLYERGTRQPFGFRLRRLKALGSRAYAVPGLVLAVTLVASAGFIFFNTNIVNEYLSLDEARASRAAYEEKFRPYAELPMPRIVGVRLEVDLFPGELRVEARGEHLLENQADRDIETVHVVFPPGLEIGGVRLEGGVLEERDDTLVPYLIFALAAPMAPGERRRLDFEVVMQREGFPHRSPDTRLVRNGTFFTQSRLAPTLGFEPDYMLEDRRLRQQHGLPPLPRRPALEDESQHHNHAARQDSDFLDFEAVLSTDVDQTALTAGRLERSWTQGGRAFFHYRMEAPMRNLYPILSARYAVARARWRHVAIEIFHHRPHVHNLERMVRAVEDSLELYSELFGPYPFAHVRIAEFPAYSAYAQAFAGTIPFSEAMGFVADVEPGDLDMPYYVTAHEMAHMWWGHVVAAANVQGDGFIHETLAQYAALRLMERTFGEAKIRRFLKEELDRYLAGRGEDPRGELPLERVENQQYIHYRKGSLVMYALRDYLGAEVVDRSLRRLVELRGWSSAPYTTSSDFIAILRQEAGPEHHGMIVDFMQKITLFDLELTGSRAVQLPDGRFEVTIDVSAAKAYAEADGTETPSPFDLPVDIGLFTRSPADPDFTAEHVISLEKMLIEPGIPIRLVVDRLPAVAGIDPYHKLIDRDSEDNLGVVR